MLFVSNLGSPVLSIINTTDDSLASQLPIAQGQGGVMDVIAVPKEDIPRKLYVAPFEGGVIEVYDAIAKRLIKNITLPNAERTFPPQLADRVIRSVTLLTGGWSMDYNPNNHMLYVANYNGNEIVIIDTRTDTVVGTIPVPVHPITVKVDPNINTLLVASLAGNALTFIDTESNEITKTLSTGNAPWGLDIDTTRHLAYVTNRGSYFITVVDTRDQNVVSRIPIGAPAQAITVDEVENMIYTSYMEQDKILKIDGRTNTILSVIDMMGIIPQDLVVDLTKTHKVYASTKFEDKIFVLGPQSLSFELPVITTDTPTTVLGFIQGHGQDVRASEPFLTLARTSIMMDLETGDGGQLTLSIPRDILDSKQANGTDFDYIVRIDGSPIEHQEIAITDEAAIDFEAAVQPEVQQSRQISFFVPPGSTSLEIIGTEQK